MTDQHRRQFISAAGALAAAASLTSTSALASDSGCNTLGPVVHMVYFWLKNPDSSADRDALIAGIPQHLTIVSGRPPLAQHVDFSRVG